MTRRNKIRPSKQLVAFAYARYSSTAQREESIDAQLRAIRLYCEQNNVLLIECFIDEAMTGKTDNRDDFQRMISGIMKGHFKVDMILVHKFNRFARNKFDSAIHKKRLKDVGVKVVSVTQPIEDSPEGAMLESIIEAMDEYYSANLALEVRKGLRENALNGRHTGGNAAFGFSVDKDGKYIPNDKAFLVKRIFEEFAAEVPKTEICERLNREGYRNQRGKHFNVRTIYDMLRNEKYIGNYIYTLGGTETIRLDGIITSIIDRDLWYKVQELCNQPIKARQRHQKARYYLTGKTYCECCGVAICGAGSKRMRNGELVYYYKCNGKVKHRNGCTNPSLNKEWFENKVLKTVINNVMSEKQIEYIAKLTFEELEAMKEAPLISSKDLHQELLQIAKKQEKLTDLYLEGDLEKSMLDEKNNTFRQRKYEIENELEKLEAVELAGDMTEQVVFDYVKDYIEQMKSEANFEDQEFMRSVFSTFIDKVVVNESSITVFVNADFSRFSVGDNRKFGGVIHRLSPVKLQASFSRKQNIFGRNE